MPLKKIASTFVSKVIAAICNFLLLFITIKFMGATQRGHITLLILNLSFVMLVAEFIAGPVLVYFFSRNNTKQLLNIAYKWILIVCSLGLFFFSFYELHVSTIAFAILCFLQCAISLNNQLLISFGNIIYQNLSQVLQPLLTLLATAIFIFLGFKSVSYFLLAFIFSSLITFNTQLFFFKSIDFISKSKTVTVFQIASKGIYTTSSNIAHLVTNRVSFFYINSLIGAAALGVYSTAISLSESILLAASSAGVVHYSNIANSENQDFNLQQTIIFSKYSAAITAFIFLVVYFIPNYFFEQLFGKDFTDVKYYILLFFPGIVALSITHIITHYFSGLGNFKIPFWSSLISCIVVGTFAEYSLLHFQQSGILVLTSIGLVIQALILIVAFILDRNKIIQKKL